MLLHQTMQCRNPVELEWRQWPSLSWSWAESNWFQDISIECGFGLGFVKCHLYEVEVRPSASILSSPLNMMGYWSLSNSFLPVGVMVCLLSSTLFVCWITYGYCIIDLYMFIKPPNPLVKSTGSWCTNFLYVLECSITNIVLRNLTSMFISDVVLKSFFLDVSLVLVSGCNIVLFQCFLLVHFME